MTHVRRTIAAALVGALAGALLLVVPASADATAPVKVSECGLKKPTARPRSLVLACADASVVLDHLRWKYWGQQVATAVGTSTENDCKPTCAAGHDHDYPIVATLWRVKSKTPGGSQFTRVTVTYAGQHPGRRAVVYDLRMYTPEG